MSEPQAEPQEQEVQEQDGPEPEPPVTPEQEAEEEEESEDIEGREGNPEPEPEASGAAGAVGEKELEKMFKRVDTANAAYAKRLGDIMGEEREVLEPCPRCASPFLGFIFPPMMQPVTADVKAAVMLSVGEEPELVTEADPYSRRCDTCQGAGRVLTGSKLSRERHIRCLTCEGRGWIAVGNERTAATQLAANASGNVSALPEGNGHQETYAPAPDQDIWGRDKDHPDYGVHPMYVAAR